MTTSKYTNLQRYVVLIRLYMNDSPELNRLIRKHESSDPRIIMAINMVLDDWTITDPRRMMYSASNFPSHSLLIKGAVIELLRGTGMLHSRNKLAYSAGGLTVQLFNKSQDYMGWIANLSREYDEKKTRTIRQMNLAAAYGQGPVGLHSEYLRSIDAYMDMFV